MTPDEAKSSVAGFLDDAQRQWNREAQTALYKIAWLRWWQILQAWDIAAECLGIFQYWNKGFKKVVNEHRRKAP